VKSNGDSSYNAGFYFGFWIFDFGLNRKTVLSLRHHPSMDWRQNVRGWKSLRRLELGPNAVEKLAL
jgi:hypothetical protein